MILFLRGIAMGIADSVPGISGGTVAFLTGIYPRLLSALRTFEWRFLFLLFSGVAFGLIAFSRFIHLLLHHELGRPYLFSFFWGLILASALLCARRIPRWGKREWGALLFGGVAAFLFTAPSARGGPLYNVQLPAERVDSSWERASNFQPLGNLLLDLDAAQVEALFKKGVIGEEALLFRLDDEQWGPLSRLLPNRASRFDLKAIGVGLIGGSAMLLPGVSGAYILTIFGYYEPAIGALAALPSREAIELLATLAVGVLIGIFLCSRLVSWLFNRWEAVSTALLIGLMLGALRALWPFWSSHFLLDPLHLSRGPQLAPLAPESPFSVTLLFWGALLFAGMGFLTVRLIEALSLPKQEKAA